MKKVKILFLGTPKFAWEVLKELIENNIEVVGVVTQPDKRTGRRHRLDAPITKKLALEHNIPVYQPVKISESVDDFKDIDFNLMITAAYGQFIPNVLLKMPEYGAFNLHGSLLPKYRGGAPIHHAIMNGEKETGISLMHMIKEMDAGKFIDQVVVPIEEEDTLTSLYETMSKFAGKLLIKNLDSIVEKTYVNTKRDPDKVTFGYNVTSKEEYVKFTRENDKVFNHIRGLDMIPGSFARYDGMKVKLFSAFRNIDTNDFDNFKNSKPGEVLRLDKTGLYIRTNDGIVGVNKLQREGKSRMEIKDFINGNTLIKVGGVFNE